MRASDFDYDLPHELIAQHPPQVRTASRLLHIDGRDGGWTDRLFADMPDLVAPGDVLVFNDTRVIKARLHGRKSTGGSVEALIERAVGDGSASRLALAHVRASKSPKPGARLVFVRGEAQIEATVRDRAADLFELEFGGEASVFEILERFGSVPLPPYIAHQADADDERRYQTVYARHAGSVAAPTAGLHFDDAMLRQLRQRGVDLAYVTLHVGAGTFRPVREEDVSRHTIHREWYQVPEETVAAIAAARERGGRVLAVGTTSLRTLETAASSGTLIPGCGETTLFVTPGYHFRVVDRLLTNFHLPKSTLMMLVSAFAGRENILAAYRHAVISRYRFFSYGDAMLLERRV